MQRALTTGVAWGRLCPVPTDEITTREAMDILGFAHRSSVHRLVQAGELHPSSTIANLVMFHRGDVEALRQRRAAQEAS